MRPNLMRLLAVLLAFTLVAAACGDDDTAEAGATGGTVTYGIIEPAWIDSFNVQESEGFEVARLLFDGLTDFDDSLDAVPAVAESWDSPDNTVWTFELRDDVKFHDGTDVDAAAFVRGFEYLADPDNLSDVAYYGSSVTDIAGWAAFAAGEADSISGVVAEDDDTLVITLNEPYALLPKAMAHVAFSPRAEAQTDPDAPIGNGPYQMRGSWEHDVKITLDRFEDYYGDRGKPDTIEFQIFDSAATMYLEVTAGNLDMADVPAEQIEAAQAEFGDRFISVAQGSYNLLGFPVDVAPFDNPDIRKALTLAIDREAINQAVFAGTRTAANSFAPSLAPGAEPCTNIGFDPAAAKEHWDAAGGFDGTLEVFFISGGADEAWVEAVANQWRQNLGVTDVNLVAQEFAAYLDSIQGGGFEGPFTLGWGWDIPSAENFLTPLFLSTASDNYTGYNSPDFDAAIAEFKAADTEEDGFPALRTAQQRLCEDMPVSPMWFGLDQKVYNERLSNVNYTVFGYTSLEDVEIDAAS